MRKAFVSAACAAVAAAVLLLPGVAGGGTTALAANGSQTSVQLAPGAQWSNNGFQVIVEVTYQCDGGFGGLNVNVAQSTAMGPTEGFGGTQVVCDGKPQKAAVSVSPQPIPQTWCNETGCWTVWVPGPPFRLGNAQATVTLWGPPSGSAPQMASDTRAIKIR